MATMRSIRFIALMLLFVLHMVSRCSAKKDTPQKYNARYRENQATETITSFPVNPYVFSAEDYDILQDAGSLQQALSIVSYESQKIDAKKPENGLVKAVDDITEKATQTQRALQHPTQLPLEKKYYEVPRKQSRSRASDPERASNASKLAAEASSLRRAYELAPPENSSHRQRLLVSTPLPLYPPLTDRTVANFGRSSDNYQLAEDDALKRKRSRAQRIAQSQEMPATDRLPRPFSLPTAQTPMVPTRTASIRQNVEFLPTAQALVATASTRTASTRPNVQSLPTARTAAVRHTAATASTRQSIPRPTVQVEQTLPTRQTTRTATRQQQELIYSTPPVRQQKLLVDQRSTLPTKLDQEQQQTAPYATEFAHHFSQQEFPQPVSYPRQQQRAQSVPAVGQRQSPPHSTVATDSREQIVTFQPPSRRRNSVRRATSTDHTEPTVVPVKQEQPIVYTIPRRPSVGSIPPRHASTVPTEQPRISFSTTKPDHQTLPYGTVPSRRNTARQQVHAHSTEQTVTQPRTPQIDRQDVQADVPPPTIRVVEDTMSQPIYVLPAERVAAKREGSSREYNDYNEYPGSKENVRDKSNDDDNKQYSYSHVERYVEPLDASTEQQTEHSYEVVEDTVDYPDRSPPRLKNSPVLQRGALRRVEPTIRSEQGLQYVDDQTQGQNVQQPEVAEAQHRPRGEEADLVQEADHHHKKHHKPKKEHHESEETGSEEHHDGEHHEHGEHGKKGYKEHHEHDEGEKGHHDKEKHDHHYDEKEGKDKEHHEEAGFQEHHEKGEEGEKKAAFREKGHHDKGHSTKGEHVIHKKDEFEKKTEFFDEFHEGGDMEKDGGHHEEHHHKKGGHHKKGHHHKGEHEKHHGEKGHHDKGHHHHEKKGHHEDEGHDHHHHHEERHGKKGGHADHKHWHHKKGDRR